MPVVHAADITEVELGGVLMSAIATPASGASELMVLRGRMGPGAEFPAHSHDREEVLLIVSGSAQATVGEEEHELAAGDALIVPANTIHTLVPAGGEPCDAVGVVPAGTRTFLPDGQEFQFPGLE